MTCKYNPTADLTEMGNEGALAVGYRYNGSVDCVKGEVDLTS